MKDHGDTYKFYLYNYFPLTDILNMAMVDFQTSEVDAKLAPVNVGPCSFVR
jgi:hypothetical protein